MHRFAPRPPSRWLMPLAALLPACGAGPPETKAPAPPESAVEDVAPEASTGVRLRAPVYARRHMVVAPNPHASRAGDAMLARGGSAIDAVVAMAVMLTLVEPQSSGIGGGGFLVHFDAAQPQARRVETYDGRETAPAAAGPDLFLDADGAPLPFFEAVASGRSVGVPGLLRMLALAHAEHGHLPWADLFPPAIALAEQGFEISPRLHRLLERDAQHPIAEALKLRDQPVAGRYFYDEQGNARPVGHRLVNAPLAAVLRKVAEQGPDAFYTGPIAHDIAYAVRNAPRMPGGMTVDDLAGYKARKRPALCGPYRKWMLCSMPPPTSGGITLLQMLGMLAYVDIGRLLPHGPALIHLFSEAGRLAYADRGLWIADPDFVDVPTQALLDPRYIESRAALISLGRRLEPVEPGPIQAAASSSLAPDTSPERPSTSHMVAVDAGGRVASMTASIEGAFGSRQMVHGFLLNNELTDFSFPPERDGRPIQNRVEPGKRPRSSMTPLIVLDETGQRFEAALGSAGGSRIIPYVARTLIFMLDYGMDVQRAMAGPHSLCRGKAVELERDPAYTAWIERVAPALRALGHTVEVGPLNSGLHGIRRRGFGYEGGADPRREGLVLGR